MAPSEAKTLRRQAPRPVLSQEPDPLEPSDPGMKPPSYAESPFGERGIKPIYPSLPKEGEVPDSTTSPSRTRGGSAYGPPETPLGERDLVPVFPLREIEQGHYVYIPFSTSDLYNWKHQNPPFSEKPQALISLLESVFNTHDPTWDDCQQLLQALFTSEERERIRGHAVRSVLGGAEGPIDGQQQARIDTQLPSTRPQWQSNSTGGREALRNYRQHLLAGLRGAARKPTNLSKVSEVLQGPEESPSAFLERLLEAYRTYTPIDPDAPANRQAINLAFATQSAPDIRRKLQRLEGFEGENREKLISVAMKVFTNREPIEDRMAKKMGKASVMALREEECMKKERERRGNKGERWPRVDRDQCAYCKERGHFKKECKKWKKKKEQEKKEEREKKKEGILFAGEEED